MEHIVIRTARWRQIVPLIGCLACIGVVLRYLVGPEARLLMLSAIVVFGAGATYFLVALWKNSKRLVIDEYGIWCVHWPIGTVRWKDLHGAFIRSDGRSDYVCFTAIDREELRLRAGRFGRVMNDTTRATGFGDLTLDAQRYGLSADKVLGIASKKISET